MEENGVEAPDTTGILEAIETFRNTYIFSYKDRVLAPMRNAISTSYLWARAKGELGVEVTHFVYLVSKRPSVHLALLGNYAIYIFCLCTLPTHINKFKSQQVCHSIVFQSFAILTVLNKRSPWTKYHNITVENNESNTHRISKTRWNQTLRCKSWIYSRHPDLIWC